MNKILLYGQVFAALVLVTSAYNFDNEDYNQLLADDLEDLHNNLYVSNVRNRRETVDDESKCPPHPKRKPKLCCGDEYMQKRHDEIKDMKSACFKEITGKDKPDKHDGPFHRRPLDPFNCEKMQEKKNEMMCVFQCIGQKNDVIDDSGSVKPAEFRKYVKNQLANIDYLVSVQDKIIDGCLSDIKNATKGEGKCKPDGLVTDFCLFKNIQLNCPEAEIKDKQFCQKLQERIKQGREFFPGPPGPPPPENQI